MKHDSARRGSRGLMPPGSDAGRASSSAPSSVPWLVSTTARRTAAQWRLLLATVTLALLASLIVTSLSLLVSATEQAGVRGALVAIPDSGASVSMRLVDPSVPIVAARDGIDTALHTTFGPDVTIATVGSAGSNLEPVTTPTDDRTFTYFSEADGLERLATLTDGRWPENATGDGAIEVALPAAAAQALDVTGGDTLTVEIGRDSLDVLVTGVFEPTDDEFWAEDRLAATGFDSEFPDPESTFAPPVTAFGPLLTAAGGMDSAGIPFAFLDLEAVADFEETAVSSLAPLATRLTTIADDVPVLAGAVGRSLYLDTAVGDSVGAVAAGLTVTRGTVLVVGLLIVVLSIAALARVSRLFVESRESERQLMRARGASRRQLAAMAALEAGAIAAVAALASPVLALGAFGLLAAQPPMVAAGMPSMPPVTSVTWLTAAGMGALVFGVLIAPVFRSERTSAQSHQSRGRERRTAAVARVTAAAALVAVAAVAYWQLLIYPSAVRASGNSSSALAVDPVLVAGPAVVLVAAVLVMIRVTPLIGSLLERLAAVTRGAPLALASWEISRRSQRATAAVLLMSLGLAIGTFSVGFLSTWKQSQIDQASVAVGAPARVEARATDTGEVLLPSDSMTGAAQPALRRPATVSTAYGQFADPEGSTSVQVLGLTRESTALLAGGRRGDAGGEAVASAFVAADPADGVELPLGSSGISATLRAKIDEGESADAGGTVALEVGAVLEHEFGDLSVLPLGEVMIDGLEHTLEADLGDVRTGSTRLVGLQTTLVAAVIPESDADGEPDGDSGEPDATEPPTDMLAAAAADLVPARLVVKDLEAIDARGERSPMALEAESPWRETSTLANMPPTLDDVPAGWQLQLGLRVPPVLGPTGVSFSAVGWTPGASIPAVFPDDLAGDLVIRPGDTVSARLGSASSTIAVAATTPLIPGSAPLDALRASDSALASTGSASATIVVDQARLARTLVEQGVSGDFVDEWWVDVPAGDGETYLEESDARSEPTLALSDEVLGERLQSAPLRVATQAALWVAIAAAALLAVAGFAVQSSASLTARRLELAQLRAIGFSRRRLASVIVGESVVVGGIAAVVGVTVGLALTWLVGPLVAVSSTGEPPVPSVIVVVNGAHVAALVGGILFAAGLALAIVLRSLRSTDPAHLLRDGAEA